MNDIDEHSPSLLLSTDEARRRLGIGLGLFNKLVALGEIPVLWVGGCRRVRVADLTDYVERLASNDR